MPTSLHTLLSSPEQVAAENASPAAIPLLSKLSDTDPNVAEAYFCNASVKHVSKNAKEGDQFCGYRNIQIQLSFIASASSSVPESIANVPSVITLQEMIENAWDHGFNANGRLQTGGIKGTRKHIGTQEAHSLLKSLDFSCKVNAFHGVNGEKKTHIRLLDFVQTHFSSHPEGTAGPIFLQRPHHSLTIIGLEVLNNGLRQLLVFDPAFPASQAFLDCSSNGDQLGELTELISPYRRTEMQLGRYKRFETLHVEI